MTMFDVTLDLKFTKLMKGPKQFAFLLENPQNDPALFLLVAIMSM